jgi:hypothetical protein
MQTAQLGFDYFNETMAIMNWDFCRGFLGYPVNCRPLVHTITHYFGHDLFYPSPKLQPERIRLAKRLADCRVAAT